MIDAALIEKCADPSLPPAIVEQFIATAGSDDPLTITVKSGGRLILVPKPRNIEEALGIMREYVGNASVRVGLTQFPAGVGINDTSQLDAGLVDACENLRRGTAMFAKIARIVTKWYGNPTSKEVLPQMVEDALYAWTTGEFEGTKVFQADDPGGATFLRGKPTRMTINPTHAPEAERSTDQAIEKGSATAADENAGSSGIRIDLSRIGGQK